MEFRWPLALIAGSVVFGTWGRSVAFAQSRHGEDRIRVPKTSSGVVRPMSIDDIVSRRDLQELRISPDGSQIALLISQAFRDSNSYRTALYVAATRPGSVPRKVLEGASLSSIRWIPDGRSISYLSDVGGIMQIWRVNLRTGLRGEVLRRPRLPVDSFEPHQPVGTYDRRAGVISYEWSPSGRLVAFTSSKVPPAEETQSLERRGIVYDDERMRSMDLLAHSWAKARTDVWVYDPRRRQERLLWQAGDEVSALAWSPDDRALAVTHQAPPMQGDSRVFFNSDIAVIALADGALRSVATSTESEYGPVWSPDGRFVAFASIQSPGVQSIGVVDVTTRRRRDFARGAVVLAYPTPVHWSSAIDQLYVEAVDSGVRRRGKSSLYTLSLVSGSLEETTRNAGHLSGCSLASHSLIAACIQQGTMQPPVPSFIDLSTGVVRSVANLNAEFDHLLLGAVSELHWANHDGVETNGFLIKPLKYEEGVRYPTLVVLYDFEGKFISDAEWITSYPAQVFAAYGFAVLLMNYPRYPPWSGNNFRLGSTAEGYGPLASIDAGVRLLIARGVSDSTRLGILGWSYGAFLAEFALTKSRLFQAASVGNGGDYNPGAYWLLGGRPYREYYEGALGGPPYGDSLRNWVGFSPAFNAGRVVAPVLMEFGDEEALFGLEMSAALRRHNVPVEFIVYPSDGHVLRQPEHRYHSMLRNLEWFAFWLLGDRPSDAPDGRLKRWSAMGDVVRQEGQASGALPTGSH